MSSSTPINKDVEKGQNGETLKKEQDVPQDTRKTSALETFKRFIRDPEKEKEKGHTHDLTELRGTLPEECSELAKFCHLIGIDSDEQKWTKDLHQHRPARNMGIYKHVVKEERAAKWKYIFFSNLFNACLGLQIVVAATLTALGAGNGPHAAVTFFGAVNTIIAGFLTYLKGSGLPNRSKFVQARWCELRDHIEQLERSFGFREYSMSADEKVREVEEMYRQVRAVIEETEPERYARSGNFLRKAENTGEPNPGASGKETK